MGKRDFGTIIEIGDILVSEDVVAEYFACDYAVCKGKCCIVGDCGAPMKESEIEECERDFFKYSPLMSEKGCAAAQQKGFFEIDIEGDIVTPLVPGTEECAYTHFDGDGNCLCAIEMAHLAGKCAFRKPISCSLYPVRVKKLTGGGLALNLHHWDICADAFARGAREKIRAYQFLKDPLIAAFGEDFYEQLCAAADYVLKERP